ncbi:hypothetical protein COU18_02625 [Candidatus Kaiserbacteria bacterium CG10_big_fil_rev_8_21_14_0_10_51_14]|uniref:Dipeptidylpeptidase IV N-terminal domain-containing protein n=1 Tax=Candidatus Kaiserbacteria bacterium CG10_big_fil_rev_8_21_14_0_10_51_14 TaxID=1974610 RepID=A0A2H0UCQ9_9BACT|nr:MAG: hypothetical protein COU18_02625 [Candidatus Kaiserbacteria bacterium CG10_big_fil_rev_8_21_14_0_10_51_14]
MVQRSLLSLCIILVLLASAIGVYYFLTRDQARESTVNPEFPFERNNALSEPPFDLSLLRGQLRMQNSEGYKSLALLSGITTPTPVPEGIPGTLLDMVASPQGTHTAYISEASGVYTLSIVGGASPISFTNTDVLADLAWSPDGTTLAISVFSSSDDQARGIKAGWNIFTLSLRDDAPTFFTAGKDAEFLSNNNIVYLLGNGIYTIMVGGTPDLVTTFDGVPPQLAQAANFNLPSLSVSSDRTQLAFSNPLEETIYLVDLVGGIPRGNTPSQKVRLLNVTGFDPTFSPDGDFLMVLHPIDGIIVYSTDSLLGRVVAPRPENTWLNNPLFAWVPDAL